MARVDALTKLNQLYDFFTRRDDGRLASGEVEALAGFFKGLPQGAKARSKARLVAIYQSSQYAAGMKERFRKALLDAGLTDRDLGRSFDAHLDKGKLFSMLQAAEEEGLTKATALEQLGWNIQVSVIEALDSLKARTLKKDHAAAFGEVTLKAVTELQKTSRPAAVVGYTADLPIYANDHDVSRRLYFSRHGILVGDQYIGE